MGLARGVEGKRERWAFIVKQPASGRTSKRIHLNVGNYLNTARQSRVCFLRTLTFSSFLKLPTHRYEFQLYLAVVVFSVSQSIHGGFEFVLIKLKFACTYCTTSKLYLQVCTFFELFIEASDLIGNEYAILLATYSSSSLILT